jgi:hypothetical protein
MPRSAHTPPHPRALAAALLTVVPLLTVVISWFLWRNDLSSSITTQWDADGPSSFAPTWLVAGSLTALSAIGTAIGIGTAFSRGADLVFSRRVFAWTSVAASAVAGMWLATAGVQVAPSPGAESAMGGEFLFSFVVAALYGLVAFGVAPRPTNVPDQYATDHSHR